MSVHETTAIELNRWLQGGLHLLSRAGKLTPGDVADALASAERAIHDPRRQKNDRFWLTICTMLGHALHRVIEELPESEEKKKEMLS